jgi:tetratricopeptide (TPR) repeat protein
MGKYFDYAQNLIEQGRYDLAEKELREEIAKNPDSDLGYGALAFCLINQGILTAETLNLINSALSLNVKNSWNHYLLSIYFHDKGRFKHAQSEINIAIKLEPDSEQYFYFLAYILFGQGRSQFAIHSSASRGFMHFLESHFIRPYLKPVFYPLEKSLAINPQYLPAINLSTNLLITTGRTQLALVSSEKALKIGLDNSITHNLHGRVLNESGKYSEAITYFQSALKIEPTLKEAKDGLLEAMRSQYWIYPWISITHWKGKLSFLLAVPVGMIAVLLVRLH